MNAGNTLGYDMTKTQVTTTPRRPHRIPSSPQPSSGVCGSVEMTSKFGPCTRGAVSVSCVVAHVALSPPLPLPPSPSLRSLLSLSPLPLSSPSLSVLSLALFGHCALRRWGGRLAGISGKRGRRCT